MADEEQTPTQFERDIAEAFRQMGAWKVEHNKRIAGNQIDVYVELGVGAGGRLMHRLAIEAKRWSKPPGVGVVNTFATIVALLRARGLVDRGVIVSSLGFTREARDSAKEHGIELLEMSDLDAMVAEAKEKGARRPTAPPIPPPPTPHVAHPYPLQDNFTGRVRERGMLTKWLTGDNHGVMALIALGGMGKSALTWVWVHRDVLGLDPPGLAADPPEVTGACRVPGPDRPEGVLWWSFYERDARFEAFLEEALTYAGGGGVDPSAIPSVHEKVIALVHLLQQRRFLLVLDGFERQLRAYASMGAAYEGDAVAEGAEGDQLACTDPHAAEFLRRATSMPLRGRVLLTSRLMPRELEGLAGYRHEALERLNPADAVAFFQGQGIKGTPAEVEAACEAYDYNPLALCLLSRLIVKDHRQPGDIQVARRLDVVPELKGKARHHILEVAYDALDEPKRELLSRIAAFRGPMGYESLAILNTLGDESAFDAALDELIDRGLLQRDREHRRYDLHPIVRQYAYDRLSDKEGTHTQLREYFEAIPAPEKREVEQIEDLTPTIELYHHTVRAGGYDQAQRLYRDRLSRPLYYRFAAYRTCIELLRALFPDGEDRPPRLDDEYWQSWTLNELGMAYACFGRPRDAALMYRRANEIPERLGNKLNLGIGLGNLALQQLETGDFASAEQDSRRSIELCGESWNELPGSVGRYQLGRLLAYRRAFDEADGELDVAFATLREVGDKQGQCIVWAHRAFRALLAGDPEGALEAAREAHAIARSQQNQRDRIRTDWLMGTAIVLSSAQQGKQREKHLVEAERHLTEALTGCRRINLVEFEPDILLAWARLHHARGDAARAREDAEEALRIADRCEYRLKQAEIHNFIARLALEGGDRTSAIEHARTGYERAWCDGPPHCYKPALDEATQLCQQLGIDPPAT